MKAIFGKRRRRRAALAGGVLAILAQCCLAQPAAPAAGADAAASPTAAGEVAAIIQAGEETTLSSQMAGRILRIRFGLGEQVKAGARLLEFDCSEGQAQLLAADAELRGARETHLARLRLQALGAAGELEVTIAASAAEKARSQVDLRQAQLAYCHVDAPFPGKIARLRVKASESVQVGQAMIDMVNTATLKIQMFVPAAWAAWLRPNSPFELRIKETGRSYPARVSKLNSRVEGVSQQLEVEARLDGNSAGLLPGMVGVAVFSPAARQVAQPMAESPQAAAMLLSFERRIRSCTSNREVSFRAVNETAGIMRHSQAVLWRVDAFSHPMVVAASGLADIAVDSPYQQWLRQVIRNAVPDPFARPHAVALADLPEELVAEGEEWSAPQLLLCPLKVPDESALGGMIFFRTEPFTDADFAMGEWITESVAFALWAWRKDRPRIRRWIMSRNVVRLVVAVGALVAAIGVIPVPLTALAPAEITSIKPIPITSPVDGVVKEIPVKPNEIVKATQVVVVLEDTAIRNRLTVSDRALDIARADLQRVVYKSFSDDAARLELQVLESRVQEKSAEVAYLTELLGKLKVTAPYGGVAIYPDSEDLRGKPVQVGERIMVIADPSLIDVTVYLPSDDAVELEAGAKVVVFLHVDPLSSIEARITRSSYEATQSPDGTLSYIVRAELLPGHQFPRIGLRGTAKIYAGQVSLAYYLFRKPLAFVRRSIGV